MCLLFFLSFCNASIGQIAIGIKWMGLTTHLKKYPYSKNYRGKLDRRGMAVVTDGIVVTLDIYLNQNWHLKIAQSYIPHDCGGKFLGMAHVGLGYTATDFHPHRGSVSFGPMFFYRRSWHGLPDYSDPSNFFKTSRNGRWQTKFVWHGGQIEYDYFFRSNQALSLNVVPAVPELFSFTPGWKYLR